MSIRSRLRQASFESPAEEAVVALLVVGARVMQRQGEVCQSHGITHDQYNVLRILRGVHPEGHPRFEIANRLVSRAPDVTRMLDRLEREGLIERAWAPENRRHSIARITARGLALLRAIDPEIRRVQEAMTSPLTQQELRALARMLDRLQL